MSPFLSVAKLTSPVFSTNALAAPPASTFYLDETSTQFSLSLANDSSDVYIYFASPAYSWVAVGFGASMQDSLMLVMYASGDGNSTFTPTTYACPHHIIHQDTNKLAPPDITLSPRLSTAHTEPSFSPETSLTLLNGTGVYDGTYIARAICHACRVWPSGFLDPASRSAPMLFAFGPGTALQSDDPAAPLRRHVRYGTFAMDLVAATGAGADVPGTETGLRGVALGGMVRDRNSMDVAHAVLGCVALFVLWPVNVVLAGFFRNIRLHVGLSVCTVVFLVVAYALGIAVSGEYIRVRSPHLPPLPYPFFVQQRR